jgi:hypothetical protein
VRSYTTTQMEENGARARLSEDYWARAALLAKDDARAAFDWNVRTARDSDIAGVLRSAGNGQLDEWKYAVFNGVTGVGTPSGSSGMGPATIPSVPGIWTTPPDDLSRPINETAENQAKQVQRFALMTEYNRQLEEKAQATAPSANGVVTQDWLARYAVAAKDGNVPTFTREQVQAKLVKEEAEAQILYERQARMRERAQMGFEASITSPEQQAAIAKSEAEKRQSASTVAANMVGATSTTQQQTASQNRELYKTLRRAILGQEEAEDTVAAGEAAARQRTPASLPNTLSTLEEAERVSKELAAQDAAVNAAALDTLPPDINVEDEEDVNQRN